MGAANQLSKSLRLVRSGEDGQPLPCDFDELFTRYAPYVAQVAYRILGSRIDVEDVVQEVFIDAERGLNTLRESGAVKGWLATITIRHAKRLIKKQRLRRWFGWDCGTDFDAVADAGASPEQRATVAAVYRLLDTFSADERIAWTLKYVQGEKVSHIAQICGCSRATAHRRIAAVQSAMTEVMDD